MDRMTTLHKNVDLFIYLFEGFVRHIDLKVTHFSEAGKFLSSHICPELRLAWTLRFYSSFWRASLIRIDSGPIRLRFHPEIRIEIRTDTQNRDHFGA